MNTYYRIHVIGNGFQTEISNNPPKETFYTFIEVTDKSLNTTEACLREATRRLEVLREENNESIQ